MIVWGATKCSIPDCPLCSRSVEIPDEHAYVLNRHYNPRHVPVIRNELVMVAEREVWGITMHSDIQHTSGYYTDVLWCDNRRGAYPRYEFAICLTPRL